MSKRNCSCGINSSISGMGEERSGATERRGLRAGGGAEYSYATGVGVDRVAGWVGIGGMAAVLGERMGSGFRPSVERRGGLCHKGRTQPRAVVPQCVCLEKLQLLLRTRCLGVEIWGWGEVGGDMKKALLQIQEGLDAVEFCFEFAAEARFFGGEWT